MGFFNDAMAGSLSFSTKGCLKEVRYSPNFLDITPKWSGKNYEVSVTNQVLCSSKIKNPSFKINGNNISLSYDADISAGASKCYCESSSVFSLSGMNQSINYIVDFKVNYVY
jgi:hypothetical protein